jgi:2-oxoglutarate dehydrogenase E2 component (dihydrolipoamide succinyltransferase)
LNNFRNRKRRRVTKNDILEYVKNNHQPVAAKAVEAPASGCCSTSCSKKQRQFLNGGDEIIEMDRMRKLIAGYMVASVQTSAHKFIEVDVTNIVKWREIKNAFEKRRGEVNLH